jgi:hypothetical protein
MKNSHTDSSASSSLELHEAGRIFLKYGVSSPTMKSVLAAVGNVQKDPSSPVLSQAKGKAAAFSTRGAYSQYVSTAKRREHRWRLFPTFPEGLRNG